MFVDKLGLIVQKDGDGGDTAHRMGWLAVAQAAGVAANSFPEVCEYRTAVRQYLRDEQLRWRRHPSQWNAPSDFSRDQAIPNIVAMSCFKMDKELEAARAQWYDKLPNGDWSTPMFKAALNRATDCPVSTFFGDLQLLVTSFVVAIKIDLNKDDVDNCLNHLQLCLLAALKRPTRLSRLATRLFLKDVDVMAALRHYFRPASGGNPELAEVYLPVISWLDLEVNK